MENLILKEFNRYKELTPEETLSRNKKALKDIGLEAKEDFIHSTKSIWTGRIEFPDIEFGTNGKGTTKLFCEASAYGEALERIQNGICAVKWDNASESALLSEGFNFFIDEEPGTLEGVFSKYPFLWAPVNESFLLSEHRPLSCAQEGEALLKEILSNNVRYLPFFNYSTKEITLLPFDIVDLFNGTNGLCSGNTPHEALVQGFSEVCERFVEPLIYKNHLTPPEISRDYLEKNYKYLFDIMRELEEQSDSSLYVYDCSLGKEFPVVCVLMIEKKTQTYRLQYGSHPLFSIAFERCLTELTQGYNFNWYSEVRRCTVPLSRNDAYVADNMENRLVRGNGDCNIEFFFKEPSWEWSESNWINPEGYTNKKGFDFLINSLSRVSDNIFIRDNGFLGVPAYTIFIPGVTTYPLGRGWHSFEAENEDLCIKTLPSVKENLLTLNRKEEWKSLCQVLLTFLDSHERPFIGDSYFKEGYFEEYEFVDVLRACLFRELEDSSSVILSLKNVISPGIYIKGICMEEDLKENAISLENRSSIINKFLGEKVLYFIENIWRKPEYLSLLYYGEEENPSIFPTVSKEDAELPDTLDNSLEISEDIKNPFDNLLLSIKRIQKERGPIDQGRLKDIL